MSVCAARHCSFVVDVHGDLWVSGKNDKGQLGINGVLNPSELFQRDLLCIPNFGNFVEVKSSPSATVLIDNEKNIWKSKICDGTILNSEDEIVINFTKISTICNVVNLSLGYDHMIVVTDEGKVWTGGCNSSGQLGRITVGFLFADHPLKELINLPPIKSSACDRTHSLLLSVDGEVFGVGNNRQFQLFDANIPSNNFRTLEENADKIFAGGYSTIIVDEEGKGRGRGSLFGDTWSEITEIPPIHSVCITNSCLMILDIEGNVWCKGENTYGQLGVKGRKIKTFTKIPDLPVIIQISIGEDHSLFSDIDGNLWVTGNNLTGELGCSEFKSKLLTPQIHPYSPIVINQANSKLKTAKSARKVV